MRSDQMSSCVYDIIIIKVEKKYKRDPKLTVNNTIHHQQRRRRKYTAKEVRRRRMRVG